MGLGGFGSLALRVFRAFVAGNDAAFGVSRLQSVSGDLQFLSMPFS